MENRNTSDNSEIWSHTCCISMADKADTCDKRLSEDTTLARKNTKATTPAPAAETTRPIPRVPKQKVRDDQEIVLPLVEEQLDVDKAWVQAGEVVVRKQVREQQQTLPVDLAYEEVQVDRVPSNRVLAEGERAEPRQEGDTLIVPVVEEQLVVLKRYVVREEVRITRRRRTRREEISDVVRSEHLEVEPRGKLQALQEDQ
jgi:uncharacterized protein (TIGR02271 family)